MAECGVQTNFLQAAAFTLVIPKFPGIQFYGQGFTLPSMSLPNATANTRFVRLPLAGDSVEFGPLDFQFLVDDHMSNYKEVHSWLMNIGTVRNNTDYTNYSLKDRVEPLGEQTLSVNILSAKNNILSTINFYDCVPISLSGIEMTQTDPDTNFVHASVSFAFTYYDFQSV